MKLKWGQIPVTGRQEIVNTYLSGGDLSPFLEQYDLTNEAAVKRYCGHFLHYQALFNSQPVFPEYSERVYNKYIEVTTDNAIIISDLEIPDVDPLMLKLAYLTGKKHGIDHMIINGDVNANDQAAHNHHDQTTVEDGDITFRTEVNLVRSTVDILASQYKRIDFTSGNHDRRAAKANKGQIHLGMLLEDKDVTYSEYAYMWLYTRRGPVYICHPQNFSANSVALGQKLYDVTIAPNGEKPHVVLGHTHHAQTGFSKDGLREIHALGCMRDPMKTRYKMMNSNTHSQWSQGFLMIRNGFFYNLTLKGTDWEWILGDLCPLELMTAKAIA